VWDASEADVFSHGYQARDFGQLRPFPLAGAPNVETRACTREEKTGTTYWDNPAVERAAREMDGRGMLPSAHPRTRIMRAERCARARAGFVSMGDRYGEKPGGRACGEEMGRASETVSNFTFFGGRRNGTSGRTKETTSAARRICRTLRMQLVSRPFPSMTFAAAQPAATPVAPYLDPPGVSTPSVLSRRSRRLSADG